VLFPIAAIPAAFYLRRQRRIPATRVEREPAGTHGFVLLCDDPDAPGGTWHHWAASDIAADRTTLPEGAGPLKHAVNDSGRTGYGGPCPPRGHGPHHYHFRLLALSTDRLPLRKDPSCRDVEREARKHRVAEAVLVGLYER
jgi:Raf kinase inhibitor-like YbhB/YbcL family protein